MVLAFASDITVDSPVIQQLTGPVSGSEISDAHPGLYCILYSKLGLCKFWKIFLHPNDHFNTPGGGGGG